MPCLLLLCHISTGYKAISVYLFTKLVLKDCETKNKSTKKEKKPGRWLSEGQSMPVNHIFGC